jgi:hypothetical protein
MQPILTSDNGEIPIDPAETAFSEASVALFALFRAIHQGTPPDNQHQQQIYDTYDRWHTALVIGAERTARDRGNIMSAPILPSDEVLRHANTLCSESGLAAAKKFAEHTTARHEQINDMLTKPPRRLEPIANFLRYIIGVHTDQTRNPAPTKYNVDLSRLEQRFLSTLRSMEIVHPNDPDEALKQTIKALLVENLNGEIATLSRHPQFIENFTL